MDAYAYPFEEFLRHVDGVYRMLDAEHKASGSEPQPGQFSFERNVIRVAEYMNPLLPEEGERQYKMQRFCLIMHYLARHFPDFDRGDFAVYGSEKVGGLVGRHLLQALHHLFTSRNLIEMGHGPTPEQVRELATQFQEAGT